MSDPKPITPEDLARLDALEKAATPGPWEIDETGEVWQTKGSQSPIVGRSEDYPIEHKPDGELVVALRNTYPGIRARIAELEAEIERLRKPKLFPIQRYGFIPWEDAEQAYRVYAQRYGTSQSMTRLAERGGFGVQEFACLWHDCDFECDPKCPWPPISDRDKTIAQQAQRIEELENLLAIQSAQLSTLREPPMQTGTST